MPTWSLEYDSFDPDQEGLREALCTLGNGYFATRGAAEEAEAGEIHYPGTYLAGGYNRLATEIAGREIINEDLVNMPNWLCLSFRPDGGDWFNLLAVEVLAYTQKLELKDGVLERRLRFRDREGRETTLLTRRLVHMGNPHLAALSWELTPENWTGRITVCSALDGRVINAGVARYSQLSSTHLVTVAANLVNSETIELLSETCQSRFRIAQTARTEVYRQGLAVEVERNLVAEEDYIAQHLVLNVEQGVTIQIEKIVGLHTSRDNAISEPALAARQVVARAGRFAELFDSHAGAWARLWHRCDVRLEGSDRAQMILRLHIFHLLQTASLHTIDLDVGVPARGLHGEAYRGHIFWDELFIFPFLNSRIPEITRALLRYRYRRLDEARRLAAKAGFKGAMYPWQSGSDGREESQRVHLNPKSGRWLEDHTHLQRHVNAAVAYNVWRYYEITGDREFMGFFGAEMLFEIARFWTSAVTWNPERQRYDIRGVMGPDEFHDRYPWREAPGLDNNAYTNVMVAWVLQRAVDAYQLVGVECQNELCAAISLSSDEPNQWDDISRKLFVPFHGDGIVSQFEGYEQLEEFDWDGYRAKYGDIHRLDRLLEAEGDTVNRYKASKQADVLMLLYLFSAHELSNTFDQLGYPLEEGWKTRTIAYYEQRTSHGSTLSRIVSSWVLARLDRRHSWNLLNEALESDIADVQGGTTAEGIHLGAMAGTVDLVQRGQTGLEVHDDTLSLDVGLPKEVSCLSFRFRFRGHWLELQITHDLLRIAAPDGWAGPHKVFVDNQVYAFEAGEILELPRGRLPRAVNP
ncbi:glycoside hydrolase family 65 protein [Pseudomonas saliphila]|uniref:glycoside hydrolase family 65 protein n=1 Tax=Pseudomonas saliphila TaxID=2586906 RepID=UPI0015B52DB9|nr:glycoside hydrolase family 65 protein [Pseudomonas saliphila]